MYWYDKLVDSNEKLVFIGIGILILLAVIILIDIIKVISLNDIKRNNDLTVLQNQEMKHELKEIKSKLDNKD